VPEATPAERVTDYLAGMTDRFALRAHAELVAGRARPEAHHAADADRARIEAPGDPQAPPGTSLAAAPGPPDD